MRQDKRVWIRMRLSPCSRITLLAATAVGLTSEWVSVAVNFSDGRDSKAVEYH